MCTRLTFYSQQGRCCVAIVGMTPCPYLLLTHFPRCCCVTWVVKVLFILGCRSTRFSPEGLIAPPFSPVKPHNQPSAHLFSAWTELVIFRTPPPPSRKTTTIFPLNVFHLSYCPWWQTTNKQTVGGIFLTPVFTHSSHTHTPATSSYTCEQLTKVVWIHCTEQNTRSSGALMHCQTPACPPKSAASSPPGVLHTFITRCSVPGGCLCKSSFP